MFKNIIFSLFVFCIYSSNASDSKGEIIFAFKVDSKNCSKDVPQFIKITMTLDNRVILNNEIIPISSKFVPNGTDILSFNQGNYTIESYEILDANLDVLYQMEKTKEIKEVHFKIIADKGFKFEPMVDIVKEKCTKQQLITMQ